MNLDEAVAGEGGSDDESSSCLNDNDLRGDGVGNYGNQGGVDLDHYCSTLIEMIA